MIPSLAPNGPTRSNIAAKFEVFLTDYYADELTKASIGETIAINYRDLERRDPELAERLLDDPEEIIGLLQGTVNHLVQQDTVGDVHEALIEVVGIPQTEWVAPRRVRSKHMNRLVGVTGTIKKLTEVMSKVTEALFECKVCSNQVAMPQGDEEGLEKPPMCDSCEKQGNIWTYVKKSSSKMDFQRIQIQDNADDVPPGSQPETIDVHVDSHLAGRLEAGRRVTIYGIIEESLPRKNNRLQVVVKRILNGVGFDTLDETHSTLTWTHQEEQEFKDFASDGNALAKLRRNFAVGIHGEDKVKDALILGIISGVRQRAADGSLSRGSIHVALFGDPSCGKSELMEAVQRFTPRCIYASGEGASIPGLTASAVRDDFADGSWSLEVGALGLANGGTFILDEADKMKKDNMGAMHKAMEQQEIEVHKASIHATINTMCNCIFAANPKDGKFNNEDSIPSQINLPPALFSRFDLIFVMRDNSKRERVESIVKHILYNDTVPGDLLDESWIQKYIAYAKAIEPRLTDSAKQTIEQCFYKIKFNPMIEDVSYRQLHALRRLAEANARLRLSSEVGSMDVEKGFDLYMEYVKAIGADFDGKLSLGEVNGGGVKTSQLERVRVVRGVIEKLSGESDKGWTCEDDVYRACLEAGLSFEAVEKTLDSMRRNNEWMQPSEAGTVKLL